MLSIFRVKMRNVHSFLNEKPYGRRSLHHFQSTQRQQRTSSQGETLWLYSYALVISCQKQ